MVLQSASRRELRRIAIGSSVCAVIQVGAFFALSLVGIGTFSYKIVTGTVGGTCMGILNFALMCIMIQKATGIEDEKLMKARVRNSYSFRKLIQVLWVVAAFLIPGISVLAAVIPLVFPNAVIYYLQATGKLLPAEDGAPKAPAAPAAPAAEPEEESEEDLGPFEA